MLAWAVVPASEEVDNLEQVMRRLRDVDADLGIIVVDGCGTHGTSAIAHRLANELGNAEVITRPREPSLGSAYREGFARAIACGADVCVQVDAELSHDPEVLPALLANIAYGADLAIGSRYVPGGKIENWPLHRLWLSRWGNRLAAGLLGLAVNDATASCRAYRVDALKRMDYETVAAEGYGFQIEMTQRLVRAGGKAVEFPIEFRARRAEQSQRSGGMLWQAVGLVSRLWLEDRRDRRHRRRVSG